MAGADQSLPTDALGDPPEAGADPGPSPLGGLSVDVPRTLRRYRRDRKRHLQGLRVLGALVQLRRFLLLLDERQVPTDGADDRVPDVAAAVDADQRLDQTVVAEHMSAAQGPLRARQALVAHRALSRVLLAVFLGECHRTEKNLFFGGGGAFQSFGWFGVIWSVGERRIRVFQRMTFFCFQLSCGRRRELRLVKQEQAMPPVAAVTKEALTPLGESLQWKRSSWFGVQVLGAGSDLESETHMNSRIIHLNACKM